MFGGPAGFAPGGPAGFAPGGPAGFGAGAMPAAFGGNPGFGYQPPAPKPEPKKNEWTPAQYGGYTPPASGGSGQVLIKSVNGKVVITPVPGTGNNPPATTAPSATAPPPNRAPGHTSVKPSNPVAQQPPKPSPAPARSSAVPQPQLTAARKIVMRPNATNAPAPPAARPTPASQPPSGVLRPAVPQPGGAPAPSGQLNPSLRPVFHPPTVVTTSAPRPAAPNMVKLTNNQQQPIGTRPAMPGDAANQVLVNGKQPAVPRLAGGDTKVNNISMKDNKEEEVETNENIPTNGINGVLNSEEDINNKNKKKIKKKRNGNTEERMEEINSIFAPKDGLDLNGGVGAADREIEQFKQFCFNSVPVQNRAKVNFDVKNIAFKKKT